MKKKISRFLALILVGSMMIGECSLAVKAQDEEIAVVAEDNVPAQEETQEEIQTDEDMGEEADSEEEMIQESEMDEEETEQAESYTEEEGTTEKLPEEADTLDESVEERSEVSGRTVVNINKGWQFDKNDSTSDGWDFPLGGESGSIDLPHSWEYTHPEKSYIPAMNKKTVTYTKELDVSEYQGRNLFLKFNGSSKNTDLYIDEKFVGTHVGGYSAFVFDITDYVQGKQSVAIRVDVTNIDTDSIPINVDYTQWAGIYRDVELISTEEQYIALEDYGSSGLYIDSTINGNDAEVSLRAKVSNKAEQEANLTLSAEVKDESGNRVANVQQEITAPAGTVAGEYSVSTVIPGVHLWQGVSDPYLYTMNVSILNADGQVLDSEDQQFGVRVFEIKDGKSYLNGEEYEIHGVGYHQDREGYGNAAGKAQKEDDVKLMLEMGVNAVRTAHYPHDQYVYELMDENGLLVYNEIPYYLLLSKAESYQSSVTEQLKEMIRQGYNHPSIVMWGMNNEVKASKEFAQFGEDFDVDSETLIAFNKKVAELAQEEDKTRYIVQATIDNTTNAVDSAEWTKDGRVDYTGLNLYVGFKSSVSSAGDTGRKKLIESLNNKLDNYKEIYDASELMLTEYGAGANINQHMEVDEDFSWNGSDASGEYHYEEYQSFVLEAYYEMLQNRDDIPLSFVWNMFDFSCYRNEGGLVRRNTKGLVCYDHETKKDAFYFYKANWNKEDKFVYLTSKRFTERNKTTQNIKAYSNCDSVDLYVNGKLIGAGKKQQDGVFVWEDVVLVNNSDIKVVANDSTGTYTDEVTGVKVSNKKVSYSVYTADTGWTEMTTDGAENVVDGDISAVRVDQFNNVGNCKLQYRTYVEDQGWTDWKNPKEASGDTSGEKKIKAIQMKLTGSDTEQFDLYYATKVNGEEWNDWAENGETSGNFMDQTGLGAWKVCIQSKNEEAPGTTGHPETSDGATLLLSGAVNGEWQKNMTNGQMVGSIGQGTPLTGLSIDSEDGSVEYDVHQAGTGWINEFKNGETAGTTSGKALQAVRIRLKGNLAQEYDVYYRVHSAKFGWLGWAKNGQIAGTTGFGYNLEALEVVLVKKDGEAPGTTERPSELKLVSYQTHVQGIGWQELKYQGETSGTSGQSKRLEAIKIQLNNAEYRGSIEYRTHIQGIGWQDWVSDGETSGTSGQSRRLEAIEIKLTGKMAENYDIYYRVHAQNFGWLDWAKNGESAGTAGYSYRLEAIEIKIVEKGTDFSGSTEKPFHESLIKYQVHVQGIGDQAYKFDGDMAGTSGQSKRLEGLRVLLTNMSEDSSVEYQAHVQTYGWQGWKKDGELAGTSGEQKRLEAVRIRLSGEAEEKYDIYYQVHVQHLGWLDWAKNGEEAGSAGFGYRLEGIRIMLVEKGQEAPGATEHPFEEK